MFELEEQGATISSIINKNEKMQAKLVSEK